MTARLRTCDLCGERASVHATWWAPPCDQHDGCEMAQTRCDDHANDLRIAARKGIILDLKVRAL